MNNISLIGRLVKDPEVKALSEKKVANFMIAVDREYKDADGQKVSDFIPCLAWSPVAEIIEKYFKKGTPIGIVGRLESRSYTDSAGNNKTFYSVNAQRVDFIQSKNSSNNAAPVAPKKQIDTTVDDDSNLPFPIPGEDDEPPF